MTSAIIHLSGFPGVGKLTIAKEIVKRPNHILLDGHKINNPIFETFGADGMTPLPDWVWDRVSEVRQAVFQTMQHAPPRFSYVMTNVLVEDEEDNTVVAQIQKIAEARGALYFPIALTCDPEENRRRIVGADRAANFKTIDPDNCDQMRAGKPQMMFLDHPNRLEVDTTYSSPVDIARLIARHIDKFLSLQSVGAKLRPAQLS